MNYTIKIWELNSKGKEQVNEYKTFDNRNDAEEFIASHKAEPKPYKMPKNKLHFTMQS